MLKITEGKFKKTKQIYEVRSLNASHLEKIIKLQNHVYEQLADKSKLERLNESEFKFILSENGLMIGVYVDNELIAVRALLDPKDDPNHLGLAIGLEEKDLNKVIYQEVSFVHPDYQGNSLQKIMGDLIMKELSKKEHPYLYVCATVAPDNIPSLKDKFAQQMEIKALVTIYGKKQRYVFAKEINQKKPKKEIKKEEYVKLADVNHIKEFLKHNFVGTKLVEENEEYFIKLVQYKTD